MAQFKLIGTAYYRDGAKYSDYICTSCGKSIQTFGLHSYPNLYSCPHCHERCEERKDSVSKVKVKRIPKKCCKTCRYSFLHNVVCIGDYGALDYKQHRFCFAEKEPMKVEDDWGSDCDKYKPIEKENSLKQ